MTSSRASSTTAALTGNLPPRNITASANDSPRASKAIILAAVRGLPVQPHPAVEHDVELARRLAFDEQQGVARAKRLHQRLAEQIGKAARLEPGEQRHTGDHGEIAVLEPDAPRQALEPGLILQAAGVVGTAVHGSRSSRLA